MHASFSPRVFFVKSAIFTCSECTSREGGALERDGAQTSHGRTFLKFTIFEFRILNVDIQQDFQIELIFFVCF